MATSFAPLTLNVTGAVDLLQLSANGVDSVHQAAAIGLELGLTWATGADATGLLGEGAPSSTKAWQAILQERQLDLCLALGGARVLCEYVQDYRRAVDRGAPQDLLQVALLRRRQVVLEHHGVRINGEADLT